MNGNILVVDDEKIIRWMLQAELEDSYNVETAENADQALELCAKQPFDLVISDINMPGIKGYELLGKIRALYPATRVALITAYNVDDYVRLAKEHGISNIIPKTTPFNFDELNALVKGLITGDIFGIERYMHAGYETVQTYQLMKSDDIETVELDIVKRVKQFYKEQLSLRIMLDETLSNAVYHAPHNAGGTKKYKKHSAITLEPAEYVDVLLVKDDEKYGISVMDKSGSLTRDLVLYKIDRNIRAEGLLDEDGRGLHMSRVYSDRFIINIQPREKTEVIMLNYFADKYKGYRPLYITEL